MLYINSQEKNSSFFCKEILMQERERSTSDMACVWVRTCKRVVCALRKRWKLILKFNLFKESQLQLVCFMPSRMRHPFSSCNTLWWLFSIMFMLQAISLFLDVDLMRFFWTMNEVFWSTLEKVRMKMIYVKFKNQTIFQIFNPCEVCLNKLFGNLSESQILVFSRRINTSLNIFMQNIRYMEITLHVFATRHKMWKYNRIFCIPFNLKKHIFLLLSILEKVLFHVESHSLMTRRQYVIKLLLSIRSSTFLRVIALCQRNAYFNLWIQSAFEKH